MTDQPENRGLDPDTVIDIPVLLSGGCGVLWNGAEWQVTDAAGRVLATATRTDVPDFAAAIGWADPIAGQVWQATLGNPPPDLLTDVTDPGIRQQMIAASADAAREWADTWTTHHGAVDDGTGDDARNDPATGPAGSTRNELIEECESVVADPVHNPGGQYTDDIRAEYAAGFLGHEEFVDFFGDDEDGEAPPTFDLRAFRIEQADGPTWTEAELPSVVDETPVDGPLDDTDGG